MLYLVSTEHKINFFPQKYIYGIYFISKEDVFFLFLGNQKGLIRLF